VPDFEDRVVHDVEVSDVEEGILTIMGIIEVLELDVHQDGTHQIRTEDDDVTLLQSASINLNRYIDKTVTVKGVMSESIGNAEAVLGVLSVELDGDSEELTTYLNKVAGYQFDYPEIWEVIDEPDEVSLLAKGEEVISISFITAGANWESAVEELEANEGTAVTVGAQKSLRYLGTDAIRFYVPNPSKNKVYLIEFTEREDDELKEFFFDFVESFSLIYFRKVTGERCGGAANLKCDEGFRCELTSDEENAAGVCVSLSSTQTDLTCPFISAPKDCNDYRVESYNNRAANATNILKVLFTFISK